MQHCLERIQISTFSRHSDFCLRHPFNSFTSLSWQRPSERVHRLIRWTHPWNYCILRSQATPRKGGPFHVYILNNVTSCFTIRFLVFTCLQASLYCTATVFDPDRGYPSSYLTIPEPHPWILRRDSSDSGIASGPTHQMARFWDLGWRKCGDELICHGNLSNFFFSGACGVDGSGHPVGWGYDLYRGRTWRFWRSWRIRVSIDWETVFQVHFI